MRHSHVNTAPSRAASASMSGTQEAQGPGTTTSGTTTSVKASMPATTGLRSDALARVTNPQVPNTAPVATMPQYWAIWNQPSTMLQAIRCDE